MRKLLLLRPQPGLSASAERARTLGLDVITCPLFEIEPLAWQEPDPARYDALLLTSANAVRCGGPGLAALKELPVLAVGEATAAAARSAGFKVELAGDRNVANLLAGLDASLRLLHLAGEHHRGADDRRIDRRIAYRSTEIEDPQLPELDKLVVVVHSPRAGKRLAELASDRSTSAIAAISLAAATACGAGWEHIEAAAEPSDNSLLALAARLCHTSPTQ